MEPELTAETREVLEHTNLHPLWAVEGNTLGVAKDDLKATVWKWDDVNEAIDRIAADVSVENLPPEVRQVVVPVNDGYGGAISHTLFVGIHAVPPGERSQAHRHGGNVLRFTIDGHADMKSIVDGEPFPMTDNDLVTTPQWEWHEHANESPDRCLWLEVTDIPAAVDGLNLHQPYEAHENGRQSGVKPGGFHAANYGDVRSPRTATESTGPFDGIHPPTPPYRFEWSTVRESIETEREAPRDSAPEKGITLEYSNPARGTGPLFPTIGAAARQLIGGEATAEHRHNATEIYYVVSGTGQSIVDGEAYNWGQRDLFVIPPDQPHYHNPDGDATLFAITDRPLLEALNFYRESAVGVDS